MTQTEITLQLILRVTSHTPGEGVQCKLSVEQKNEVIKGMMDSYDEGEFPIRDTENNRDKHENPSTRRKYMSAKISDMLKSHCQLKSDGKSRGRGTGTTTGNSDPRIIEMKKLLTKYRDNSEVCERVQVEIDKVIVELTPTIEIDETKLPSNLLDLAI